MPSDEALTLLANYVLPKLYSGTAEKTSKEQQLASMRDSSPIPMGDHPATHYNCMDKVRTIKNMSKPPAVTYTTNTTDDYPALPTTVTPRTSLDPAPRAGVLGRRLIAQKPVIPANSSSLRTRNMESKPSQQTRDRPETPTPSETSTAPAPLPSTEPRQNRRQRHHSEIYPPAPANTIAFLALGVDSYYASIFEDSWVGGPDEKEEYNPDSMQQISRKDRQRTYQFRSPRQTRQRSRSKSPTISNSADSDKLWNSLTRTNDIDTRDPPRTVADTTCKGVNRFDTNIPRTDAENKCKDATRTGTNIPRVPPGKHDQAWHSPSSKVLHAEIMKQTQDSPVTSPPQNETSRMLAQPVDSAVTNDNSEFYEIEIFRAHILTSHSTSTWTWQHSHDSRWRHLFYQHIIEQSYLVTPLTRDDAKAYESQLSASLPHEGFFPSPEIAAKSLACTRAHLRTHPPLAAHLRTTSNLCVPDERYATAKRHIEHGHTLGFYTGWIGSRTHGVPGYTFRLHNTHEHQDVQGWDNTTTDDIRRHIFPLAHINERIWNTDIEHPNNLRSTSLGGIYSREMIGKGAELTMGLGLYDFDWSHYKRTLLVQALSRLQILCELQQNTEFQQQVTTLLDNLNKLTHDEYLNIKSLRGPLHAMYWLVEGNETPTICGSLLIHDMTLLAYIHQLSSVPEFTRVTVF